MSTILRDTRTLYAHNLRVILRSPFWVIMGIFQPVLYLLLFAPLLDSIQGSPGFPEGDGLAIFTPAAMLMISMFGPIFAGFMLVGQIKSGEVERLTVTPASRLSLLLGNVLRDVTQLLSQGILLVIVAVLLGLQIKSLAGMGLALVLLVLLGLMLASCSYGMALTFKSEGALTGVVQLVSQPLLLLSGILLPLSLAPQWIRSIASLNPFAYATDAMRSLFAGELGDPSVLKGFGILAVLTALALWWASRAYRRFNA